MTRQTDTEVLQARAAVLARPLAVTEHGSATPLLAFELGGSRYALALTVVFAVVELGDVAVVPGAVATLLGVTSYRGVLLPVANLSRILGQPSGTARLAPYALVLGDGRPEVAIPVMQLPELFAVDLTQLRAMPIQIGAGTDARLYRGLAADAVTVLDATWLLTGPSCRFGEPARHGQGEFQ
jgi:chemotaxis signal transduction protein